MIKKTSVLSSVVLLNLLSFANGQVFELEHNPSVSRAITITANKNSTLLDFFAGSSTTAHSTMKLNAEDGGNRKFIMVQLQEVCGEKSEAYKAGFKTISDISKERIRRVGKTIVEGDCHPNWSKDVGFRVLKIDSTNMAEVYYNPDRKSVV